MKELTIPKTSSLKEIKEKIAIILVNLEYKITDNGTDQDGSIVLSKGMSIFSYGERIILQITAQVNKYHITIQSESIGIQIIDWGNNAENEEQIALALTNELT